MSSKTLKSTTGEYITWFEATIRATRGLGRPARVSAIEDYMESHVVARFPETASTPRQTICKELYTHSKDSIAGRGNRHVFFSPERGVWGLADGGLAEEGQAENGLAESCLTGNSPADNVLAENGSADNNIADNGLADNAPAGNRLVGKRIGSR